MSANSSSSAKNCWVSFAVFQGNQISFSLKKSEDYMYNICWILWVSKNIAIRCPITGETDILQLSWWIAPFLIYETIQGIQLGLVFIKIICFSGVHYKGLPSNSFIIYNITFRWKLPLGLHPKGWFISHFCKIYLFFITQLNLFKNWSNHIPLVLLVWKSCWCKLNTS